MNDKERPAEPVVGDEGTLQGGFAETARHLNLEFPSRRRPISRQLVYKWWTNRHMNRFPEAISTSGTGRGRSLFDINAVIGWYTEYSKYRSSAFRAPATCAPAPSVEPTRGDEGTLAA